MNEVALIALASLAFTVLNGVLLFLRTGRTDNLKEGAVQQRLVEVEKKTASLEIDVAAAERALQDIRITVATIPEQIRSQKELMTMQFEAMGHAIKNLRLAVEALGRGHRLPASSD